MFIGESMRIEKTRNLRSYYIKTILSLLAFYCMMSTLATAATKDDPFIPMEQALELAEAHLRKNNVDTIKHYKAAAIYKLPAQNEDAAWRIEWRLLPSGEIRTLGGNIVVYIFRSGESVHVYDD